jgi:hypothetical protein
MVLIKRLLCPARVRKVPKQFSWVDHRLVRDRYIEHCDAYALALYLFLVTVADDQGLSYYPDAAIAQRLSMDGVTLNKARQALTRAQLIAYEKPLYQVLALGPPCPLGEHEHRRGEFRSIRALLAQSMGKAS